MKFKTYVTFLIICFSASSLFSCQPYYPDETFDEEDAPVELIHDELSFKSPWGYDKFINSLRNYPLLVSGMWGEGESQYEAESETHPFFPQEYPAFVMDYQKTSESDGEALALWIRSAIDAGFRIDTDRIYLTGFSWGGSSSYPLAKGMYAEGLYFAAIIRCAGGSQSDLTEEIAEQTAVWYHIGLEDTEDRVAVAREALEYMRNYDCNKWALESEKADTLSDYERITVTLTRGIYPMFKYSEYTGMGHTSGPCYTDTDLFPWLFDHSLKYR